MQGKAEGNIISTSKELKTPSHCLSLYSTANMLCEIKERERKHADLLKYLLPEHNPTQQCLKEDREAGMDERGGNGEDRREKD